MTKGELRNALDQRISTSKVSGFWTTAMKDEWINTAGQAVASFRKWPFLELALVTTSDGTEYYPYPKGPVEFQYNSIYNLKVDGETYPGKDGRDRVKWNTFRQEKELGSNRKIFANHNGFYFLHPVPAEGVEISIYGIRAWKELVNDSDEPITPETLDEPIIRTALATCLRKAKRYSEAQVEMNDIFNPQMGMLINIWNQYEEEGAQGFGGQTRSTRW